MQLNFSCPRCDQPVKANVSAKASSIACPHCRLEVTQPTDAWQGDRLTRCLVCPSSDLFVRKDFPQRLGVAIVVLGFGLSCVTWFFYWTTLTFAVLFVTALADFVLYLVVGDSVVCYRCHAEYRQLPQGEGYGTFDLETYERCRQQAARLRGSGFRAQGSGRPSGADLELLNPES